MSLGLIRASKQEQNDLAEGSDRLGSNKEIYDEEPKKKTREDWRKAKELEEARKAGTAPAAVDEEGKDINPHIPQYISSTPWYFGSTGPTLKHQRPQPEKQKEYSKIDEWYIRGTPKEAKGKKWRPGACDNCGAMGHKRKDCFEKPRKIPAKYSNTKIAPDDFQQPDLLLDYDAKRDRWAGYDASEHKTIIEEYQKVEEMKKQLRAEKLTAEDAEDAEEKDDEDSDKDEDKYVDEVDMPGTKVDSKQRITVRNLRIREDTAKYLRNLDINSAYYDPKTRSMRDNPYAGTDKEVDYQGENLARFSGDTREHANAQLFAWEAYNKGVDVHLLAEPTKLELLKQEYDKKRDELKNTAKESIIDKYGGEEHLNAIPRTLLLAQTEEYVEYSRDGKVIKGREKQVIRSRYEEDVFPMNHTSVFGSYWTAGKWGYKCCHSFLKNSYCTGDAGKLCVMEAENYSKGISSVSESRKPAREDHEDENLKHKDKEESSSHKDKKNSSDNSSNSSSSSSSCSSEDSSEEDTRTKTEKKSNKEKKKNKKKKLKEKKKLKQSKVSKELQEALRKEEEHQKEAERLLSMDERKRPYNSMYTAVKPTEEEVEAYQMKRMREEDPMSSFM